MINTPGFRSPSRSSVLALSSVPVLTPSHSTTKYQHQGAVTPDTGPPQRSMALAAEASSEYLYGINDLSSLLDEHPYQSSLSDTAGG